MLSQRFRAVDLINWMLPMTQCLVVVSVVRVAGIGQNTQNSPNPVRSSAQVSPDRDGRDDPPNNEGCLELFDFGQGKLPLQMTTLFCQIVAARGRNQPAATDATQS
jgi:hypothetical protein